MKYINSCFTILFLIIWISIHIDAQIIENYRDPFSYITTEVTVLNYGSIGKVLEVKEEQYQGSRTRHHNIIVRTKDLDVLKKSLETAIEWIELNKAHKKKFTKEVCCRFYAIQKYHYEINNMWDTTLAFDVSVIFKGHENGNFTLHINALGFTTSKKEFVEKFLKILNGKSANKDIDEIFKD